VYNSEFNRAWSKKVFLILDSKKLLSTLSLNQILPNIFNDA